jgi:hypothetical protein
MKQILYLILAVHILTLSVLGQSPASTPIRHVRDAISADVFQKAGLSKLSEDELRELSGALFGWKPAPIHADATPVPTPEALPTPEGKMDAFGREHVARIEDRKAPPEPKQDTSIRSRIRGTFTGWKGKTVFTLENGQVWRQTDRSEFSKRLENPEVIITRGIMGSYYLSVEGHGSRCKVTRVK